MSQGHTPPPERELLRAGQAALDEEITKARALTDGTRADVWVVYRVQVGAGAVRDWKVEPAHITPRLTQGVRCS